MTTPARAASRRRSVGPGVSTRRTRATRDQASDEEKRQEDVDTDVPQTPTQALIGEIDEALGRSSSEEAEERSASAQVEGTLADTVQGERGDAPDATDTQADSTGETSDRSSDSDDESSATMSGPTGFAAELDKKRAAAAGRGRTDAEMEKQSILYPRHLRGVGKDADKLRSRFVDLAPKDSIGRLKPDDIKSTAELSNLFVDSKTRKDHMKNHCTMYDVYYVTEIPVVTFDANGDPVYVQKTDTSGNIVYECRPLMDPAFTDVIPMEQVRFLQSSLKRYGDADDATSLKWLQEYFDVCVEDTLTSEAKDDMERLAVTESDRSIVGPLVFYKLVYDKMTTYHEEQNKAAVASLTNLKPSDFDGEDIDKFANHLTVLWTYLSGVPGGKDYRPYDVIEQIMDNLAEGTSCAEFSEKFTSTKSQWQNPLVVTELDNKTVDERFHAVLKLARHEYQRLSVTKEDGSNDWTGAGRKAEGSVFHLNGILCWNCGKEGHRAPDCPEEKVKPYRYAPTDGGKSRGKQKSGRSRGNQKPRSKYPSSGDRRAPKGDEVTKGRSMTNLITGTVETHWPCATCRTSFGDGWSPHQPGKNNHQAYLQRRTQLQKAMATVDTGTAAAADKKEEDDRIEKIIAAKVSSAMEQAVPQLVNGMKAHFAGNSEEDGVQYGNMARFHLSSKE